MFADAMNECGLAFAGLAFTKNCHYYDFDKSKKNYTPYELPLILLSTCKNIEEVKFMLKDINLLNEPFSKEVPLAPLHFMISDKKKSIVIETLKDGTKVYDNPFNVLTNNPPFSYHKENVSNYLQLHNASPLNLLNKEIKIDHYSYNQGAIGLPGDFSSSSRFIKCFYVKSNLILDGTSDDIIEFFKCLDSVSMVKGSVKTEKGYEITRYTVCYDLDNFVLLYKTYSNSCLSKIELKKTYNDDGIISTFPILDKSFIYKQN